MEIYNMGEGGKKKTKQTGIRKGWLEIKVKAVMMPVPRVCHGDSVVLWKCKIEFLVLYVLLATLVS